jgi:hypothetical protein
MARTLHQLTQELKNGATLVWNDPDYIEGNDYKIVSIKELNDEIALIQYNQGLSEAEVFLHEINFSN